MYDKRHPPPHPNQPLRPTSRIARCQTWKPADVVQQFVSGRYHEYTGQQAVLVSTPCLGPESLGNFLSDYFETLMCARRTGAHMLTLAMVYDPKNNHTATPFLRQLPRVVERPHVKSYQQVRNQIRNICKCPGSCHERATALWTQGTEIISPIFRDALRAHMQHLSGPDEDMTVVQSSDLATVAIGARLPLIPDAAVHYRCGDNFIGHYGLLPFAAIRQSIPQYNTKTIYVLAESKHRKANTMNHHGKKCDAIFSALFEDLQHHYPSATVVIRRGGDIYSDLARLTFANITVCSVSTYCLWPAVASTGVSYFPVTRLINGGRVDDSLGFHWITKPNYILGHKLARMSVPTAVQLLRTVGDDAKIKTKSGPLRKHRGIMQD